MLEAGGRYEIQDFVNNEWESFAQLAWTDMRTTSGAWRVSQELSQTCLHGSSRRSAARRCIGPAHRCDSRTTSSSTRTTITVRMAGANLLDWPLTLAELEPYYDEGREEDGRHPHQRNPRPSRQQQLQGASKPAPRRWATRKCTLAAWRSTASRVTGADRASRSASASRAANPARNGATALYGNSEGRGRPATARSPLRKAMAVQDRARCHRQGDRCGLRQLRRGTMHRQKARVVVCVAGNSDRKPAPAAEQRIGKIP